MKTQNNTVLITGGSAGIGFEIAKLFAQNGNQVIITGRNAERLQQAAAQLDNTTAIVSDVSNPADVDQLVERLNKDFPTLNLVINNAGRAFYYSLSEDGIQASDKAGEEMTTNYLSIIRLTEKLLPLLKKQSEAALVNVSSIVAFVPGHTTATYSASKAALHAYTQAMRYTLAKDTSIKVFELMPPLVNTDFSQEIGGINGISPTVVAQDLLTALATDTYEIHVGNTATLYKLFLSSPEEAFLALNTGR
ncbi:SDR family oxidoreductase [Larkinella humicola]|uniref:SDR family NAD(P)-dependent oxidoreductase n=1 Tax=Larkinella humicola TaxID=2607654 RepID=A0A5N1J873_9BACT|nr:SDR family NAD(P)-dependent oxidoreductase [Larkinella humicola]KAA9347178.1 SDR family NAD(P)-dependent oxidoreductase [Larkinella humicola]